jgi:RNA polymerase sigma-70 factor (ECF subfamily)
MPSLLFRAEAKLSTWLTRIVINQALARRRSPHRDRVVVLFSDLPADERVGNETAAFDEPGESPEQSTPRADMSACWSERLTSCQSRFVPREVEDLSGDETAACLSIPEATVRSRLFRARGMLRESLASELDMAKGDVFSFGGERCDRVVAGVLTRGRALAAACHKSVNEHLGPDL